MKKSYISDVKTKTRITRLTYNKNSKFYDFSELPVEFLFFKRWRRNLFKQIKDGNVLEVGIGTGKNLPYYPRVKNGVAVDLSEGMLKHAKELAVKKNIKLVQSDAQNLPFRDESFDIVISTYVFCSVPEPLHGLNEIRRVLKLNGELIML
ncbi:MAG TPA: class I SAM-dependent methyltransferase, partial [Ignavibacteria bacterium]|nr:class I SAM-dependent methyltransferase [Ignavibacteria bacterium]